jgi:D-arabinose 1-dehydrogenase-like Zn-dependent alcohol dehydrogenase
MSSAMMQGSFICCRRERTQIEEVAVPAPEGSRGIDEGGSRRVCGTDIHVWQGDNHQMPGYASSATNFLA